MSSGYSVNSVDLDSIFDPYVSGTKAAATGYVINGVDLSDRYAPISVGSSAAATGYAVNGIDLNTLFAAFGTAQYVSVNITNQTVSGTSSGQISAAFTFRNDGQLVRTSPSGSTNISSQWLTELSSLEAAKYEIRATLQSGAIPNSGPTLGVWHSLDITRTWSYTKGAGSSRVIGVLLIEIRVAATGEIKDSATFTYDLEGNL